MKVAVLGTRGFPGVQGGVEAHCENLYPRLARRGCEVAVFMRSPYVPAGVHRAQGVECIPIDCPRNKFLEAIVHTYRGIWRARRLHPHILHIHAIGPSGLAPLARLLGLKVVMTHHGPDYMRKKWPWPAKAFLRLCEWAGVTFSNEVIVIAQNIADELKKKYGRDCHIIPNGVTIQEPARTEEVLTKFGLKKGRYVLAVGRFVPEKGFDDLIDAFDSLRKDKAFERFSDWKLAVVGDADFKDSYSQAFKKKAAGTEGVVLTGFLTGTSLREIYSHAGLFVLPSYYEGLPLVLLEAMSYGLSCIASDIPANRNVHLHPERFFPAGDPSSLKKELLKFIQKPFTSEEVRSQSELLRESYDWEKITDRTLEIYGKAAGNR